MSSAHVALTVVGGVFDLSGGALVGFAEVSRRAHRLRERGANIGRAIRAKLPPFLRRRRDVYISAEFAGMALLGGRGHVMSLVDADAPVERQLAFMRAESERTQNRLNAIEDALEDVPKQLRDEAASQREELVGMIDAKVAGSEERYDSQRFWGVVLVAVGGVLLAAANLVQ
jgi:hypothetical protein